MTRYEILIKLNDEMLALDTYDVDPIQLTYNIADIKDFGGRNSSFSKTIKLPETGNNRQIFEDIGSLDIESNFNPNIKTEAWILVDTVVIFKGFLQFTNIVTDLEFNTRDYEVVIYADNDNFFTEIGDRYLTDLDYSELNHTWRKQNIIESWTADLPYFYPLIDYGYNWNLGLINGFQNSEVNIYEMYPATNVKYILDKIFSNIGYSYESNFLNSRVFKNLFIPFNHQNFVNTELIDTTNQIFNIGMLSATTIVNTSVVNVPAVSGGQPGVVDFGFYRIPFANEQSPYGDPNNVYDVSLFEYVAPSDYTSSKFIANIDIVLPTLDFVGFNQPQVTSITFKRSKDPLTGIDVAGGVNIPINGSIEPIYIGGSNDVLFSLTSGATINDPVRVTGQISTEILSDLPTSDGRFNKLFPTEKVWVELNIRAKNTNEFHTLFGEAPSSAFNINTGTFNVVTVNTANNFFNIINTNLTPGDIIPYISAIPKKFKQKDFITSIIKMFNLYIEPSKDFEKTLIIEPRDQFYQGGVIKDWTKKLDTTQPLNIQILGDTQNNEILLTYKKDSDFYSEDYFNSRTNNEIYGQFDKFIDNDFVKGIKKIQVEFASTPLVNVEFSSRIIIPQIFKVENNVLKRSESTARILTKFYSSTEEPWVYDDFIFYGDSGQPNNAKTMLSTSGFTNVPHTFSVGDVVTIVQNDGGVAQPWITGTWEIVEIPDNLSIVIDVFFVEPGGPAVGGVATPVNGLVGSGVAQPWIFEGDSFQSYPYLGHFNHPLAPNYDINFGQTDGLYYETNLTTNQNLYEVYWKNSIEELTDKTSRIVSGNFYLSPQDIADFKFNDSIFIDGQYYKVNKITYDPTKTVTSQVELIKSDYETIPIEQGLVIGPIPVIRGDDLTNPSPSINVGIKPGNISTSSTNALQGTGNIVTGQDNVVNKQNNVVNGNNNIVSGSNSLTNGNNNIVGSSVDNSFVLGNNNTLSDGISNSLVIGDNITPSQSNTLFTGAVIFRDNITGSINNNLLLGNDDNTIDDNSTNASIVGGTTNKINSNLSPPSGFTSSSSIVGGGGNIINAAKTSTILGGTFNTINASSIDSAIIGGELNILNAVNTVMLGCSGVTANQSNTVYVPNIVIVKSVVPSGTTDTQGIRGQISWDDNYLYVKTSTGWKRSGLSSF